MSEFSKVERSLELLRIVIEFADAEVVGFLANLCRLHVEATRLADPVAARTWDAAQIARRDAAFQAFMKRASQKPKRTRRKAEKVGADRRPRMPSRFLERN